MNLIPLIVAALIALTLGAPIFLSMLAPTIISFEFLMPHIPSLVIPQKMVDGINSFSLMAVPLFIFAADVIAQGAIGGRLVRMVESYCGHLRAGLAIAAILACTIFGAMSGIGPAAIVSIGPIVYPMLIRQGYGRGFSVGLIVSASTLSMLIPPGVSMILFALTTNTSVGQLFMAGLGSGILFALILCLYAYAYAWFWGIQTAPRASWRARWARTREGLLPLGMPITIIGGIYGGIATPTEAAAFACIYAIAVEWFVYKTLTLRTLMVVARKSAGTSSILLILVAAGTVLGYLMTIAQVPQQISSLLSDYSAQQLLFLINILFLLAGMVIDPNSLIIVLVPLLFPATQLVGIDPVHFGAITVANLAIGMLSPPFGINLFIAIATFRLPYFQVVKAILPFIGIMLVLLALVTYFSGIPLFIPNYM
jgi:C4-dicarboxylate transporter, DctM subunit